MLKPGDATKANPKLRGRLCKLNVLIVGLNSKYIHTSLAPWYLKAECQKHVVSIIKIVEMTVNIQFDKILENIYVCHPDVLALSCYIFNMETVDRLVDDIKKILPETKVILGGPEVSYDAENQLRRLPGADFVVSGEGEIPFWRLLRAMEKNRMPDGIPGVTFRGPHGIVSTPAGLPPALDSIASPYTAELLEAARDKIIYYESSRGCPYRCSYCLSSVSGGVRFFGMERVKSELARLLSSDVRQIKFVDRTFNCHKSRAKEIFRFLIERAGSDKTGKTVSKNIHFEMAADLFDEEMIDILRTAPAGFFQFEIGIQSFNGETLSAVSRKTNLEAGTANIRRLLLPGNIHIHLDLIAGLPLEGPASFVESFNLVYSLRPHVIQLGFLKLLKGSEMRRTADGDGYAYSSRPPYEILRTPWMSYRDLCFLKLVAETVERLYNSGKFARSCDFAVLRFPSPYDFYSGFASYLDKCGCFGRSVSTKELYGLFYEFARSSFGERDLFLFGELLKFDFFSSDHSAPPASLPRAQDPGLKALYRELRRELPQGALFHLETFAFNPLKYREGGEPEISPVTLRFDYSAKDRVTGLYQSEAVPCP